VMRKLVQTDARWPRTAAGIAILSAVVILVAVVYGNSSATNEQIFIQFAINVVLAVGIQTFMGLSGVVTFGHVGLMSFGAYSAALLTTPVAIKEIALPNAPGFIRSAAMGFAPATVIAVVVTGVIALGVGVAIVRLSGTSATIATYALYVISQSLLINAPALTRGNQTFYGVPSYTTLGLAAGAAIGTIAVARVFQDSRVGLFLKATREDSIGAASTGVSIFRSRLAGWVLSGAIVGLGGSLYAHFVTAISPSAFSLQLTFTIVIMVILGGRGVTGAVVGATFVTVVNQGMTDIHAQISIGSVQTQAAVGAPIILGLLVILTMARRPRGVVGDLEVEDLLEAAGRRLRWTRRDTKAPPAETSPVAEGEADGEGSLPAETAVHTQHGLSERAEQ
jgi:branched-chain amino acid transport system permease protein